MCCIYCNLKIGLMCCKHKEAVCILTITQIVYTLTKQQIVSTVNTKLVVSTLTTRRVVSDVTKLKFLCTVNTHANFDLPFPNAGNLVFQRGLLNEIY
jgi:hypothetical protein